MGCTGRPSLKGGGWSCRFSQMVRVWAVLYKGPFCSKGSRTYQQHKGDCSLLRNICREYLKYTSLESVPTFMLPHAIGITLSPLQNTFENKNFELAALFLPHQSAFFCWTGFHLWGCLYPPTTPIPEKSKAALSSSGIKMNKNIMRLSMSND